MRQASIFFQQLEGHPAVPALPENEREPGAGQAIYCEAGFKAAKIDGAQANFGDKAVGCGAGGLSGAPLRQRSLAVLERVRARVGDRLVLIAAGGIATAEHARERLAAGATLVQLYTSFVYQGPLVASRIARGLAARDST